MNATLRGRRGDVASEESEEKASRYDGRSGAEDRTCGGVERYQPAKGAAQRDDCSPQCGDAVAVRDVRIEDVLESPARCDAQGYQSKESRHGVRCAVVFVARTASNSAPGSDPDNLLRGQRPGECPAGESRACHLCFRRSLLGTGFFGVSRCERHAPEICARCSQRQSPILRFRSGAKMY